MIGLARDQENLIGQTSETLITKRNCDEPTHTKHVEDSIMEFSIGYISIPSRMEYDFRQNLFCTMPCTISTIQTLCSSFPPPTPASNSRHLAPTTHNLNCISPTAHDSMLPGSLNSFFSTNISLPLQNTK